MYKFMLSVIAFGIFCNVAHADVASVQYVNATKSDWNEVNENSPRYIANKPKITESISDASTNGEIPTAKAVSSAIESKANQTDVKFDSIPTSRPASPASNGRALIWVEE